MADQADQAKERVAGLLRKGLDHYGVDEVSEAISAWREVLAVDPGNIEARDYIKTADRRSHPRPDREERTQSAVIALVKEARELFAQGELEPALDLLSSASEAELSSLELDVTIDLIRSRLFEDYCKSVGDLGGVPLALSDSTSITSFNLPSNAGFLLSLVDGATSLADLITLSGMDAFEAIRTFKGLSDAGIVRMQP